MQRAPSSPAEDTFAVELVHSLARGGYSPSAWRRFFIDAARQSGAEIRARPARTRSFAMWMVGIVGVAVGILALLGATRAGPRLSAANWTWFVWYVLWGSWLAAHLGLAVPASSARRGLLLPNGLSAARLLLAPLAGFAVLAGGSGIVRGVLAAFVVLLALTDAADGRIARRWGLSSRLGAALDVLADVALMGALALGLHARGVLPPALFGVAMLRYVVVVPVAIFLYLWRGPFPLRSPSWSRMVGGVAHVTLVALAVAVLVLPAGLAHGYTTSLLVVLGVALCVSLAGVAWQTVALAQRPERRVTSVEAGPQ